MSIDMSKMPKIGFGLMRLPENDGVIDIDKVSKMADSYLEAGFTYFDNERGAFLFSKNYNAYIELISFDKMLSDSELRNKVFFKKLGIE